jgi:hypothetical protein
VVVAKGAARVVEEPGVARTNGGSAGTPRSSTPLAASEEFAVNLVILCCSLAAQVTFGSHPPGCVPLWGLWELTVHHDHAYANPFTDVFLKARLLSPTGRQYTIEGFYAGAETWKVRFMPDEEGRWTFELFFSDGSHAEKGNFTCSRGGLPGPLRVRRKTALWFECTAGAPLYLRAAHLWWVDALEPSVLASTLDYLKQQGFNAVVGPHLGPGAGTTRFPWALDAQGRIDFRRFNLDLWNRLDRALTMLAERHMVLIPFSILGGTNDVPKSPDRQAIDLLLRYWVARWQGFWNATYQPTSEWEEGYSEEEILWIGQRLKELCHGKQLVSVHSLKASSERVQDALWYDYHTVQDKLDDANFRKYRWFVELWRRRPKPILAHECLWEGNFYQREAGVDIENLRRAAWVIALSGGHINYADELVAPGQWRRHPRRQEGTTFSERGMAVGVKGRFYPYLKHLADLMESVPWWETTPAPELASTRICLAKPGRLYMAYSPVGDPVELDLKACSGPLRAWWFNPREGTRRPALGVVGEQKVKLNPPAGGDWVLVVTDRSQAQHSRQNAPYVFLSFFPPTRSPWPLRCVVP